MLEIHLWANANAAKWDTYGQGVAVWMTSEVMRPILQLATRILKPPQPIIYANEEHEAMAFLAQHQTVRSHVKAAY